MAELLPMACQRVLHGSYLNAWGHSLSCFQRCFFSYLFSPLQFGIHTVGFFIVVKAQIIRIWKTDCRLRPKQSPFSMLYALVSLFWNSRFSMMLSVVLLQMLTGNQHSHYFNFFLLVPLKLQSPLAFILTSEIPLITESLWDKSGNTWFAFT